MTFFTEDNWYYLSSLIIVLLFVFPAKTRNYLQWQRFINLNHLRKINTQDLLWCMAKIGVSPIHSESKNKSFSCPFSCHVQFLWRPQRISARFVGFMNICRYKPWIEKMIEKKLTMSFNTHFTVDKKTSLNLKIMHLFGLHSIFNWHS